ncbi:MAG: DNA-directed RNA polymerase subunit omega [Candidatus Omnitrophica bacterium]|nr:DNA-directed RNA polymerase subunit omega [Candidatus Omnitrophota bacterium]
MKDNTSGHLWQATGVFCAEDLIGQSGSGLFSLVRMAMLRSAELADGRPALIEHGLNEKIVTVVFKEIAQGKVALKTKKR